MDGGEHGPLKIGAQPSAADILKGMTGLQICQMLIEHYVDDTSYAAFVDGV